MNVYMPDTFTNFWEGLGKFRAKSEIFADFFYYTKSHTARSFQ